MTWIEGRNLGRSSNSLTHHWWSKDSRPARTRNSLIHRWLIEEISLARIAGAVASHIRRDALIQLVSTLHRTIIANTVVGGNSHRSASSDGINVGAHKDELPAISIALMRDLFFDLL